MTDDARTRLQAYADQVVLNHPTGGDVPLRQVAPAAFEALEAVLDLHRADRGAGVDAENRCFECCEVMPCPTVAAIRDHLPEVPSE